jgi:hypothetical protein
LSDVLPTPAGGRPEPTRPAAAVPRPAGPQEPTPVEGAILDPTETLSTEDPWALHVEVLPGAPLPPQDRIPRRGATALVAAGVAAVLVGGAAVAWAAFNGDTGDQPEKHLPATAGAMVKVDLDPSGSQKIDAIRFLRKFPLGSGLRDTDDPRRYLYERLAGQDASAPPWSEVEPWLGARVALAALPGERNAVPVAVLQVTDEAKARASLAKAADDDTAFAVDGGWAMISDTQAHLDAAAQSAATTSLADDATFRRDVDALGDAGVVTAWADPVRLPNLGDALRSAAVLGLPTAVPRGGDLLKQRYAGVARFTGGNAELVVRTFGSAGASTAAGAGPSVAALPEGTVAGFGVSGAGDTIRTSLAGAGEAGQLLSGALVDAEQRTGLQLPEDLQALLGQRAAIALGEPDGSGRPVLGLRAASDAAGLGPALDRLLSFTDASGLPLERRDVPGGYVLATDRTQAEAMTRDGGLGDTDAFRDAVPDADSASVVAYLDVERLLATYGRAVDGDLAAALRPLRAVGLAVAATGDGTTTTLRVTTR